MLRVARYAVAAGLSALFAAALVQTKGHIGQEREPVTNEDFRNAAFVTAGLVVGVWVLAVGRR